MFMVAALVIAPWSRVTISSSQSSADAETLHKASLLLILNHCKAWELEAFRFYKSSLM